MEPEDLTFSPKNLAKLIDLTDAGTINSSVAKKVFEQIFTDDVDPEKYVEENGLGMVNDESALREVIEKVLADNPKAVEDYRGGKEKAYARDERQGEPGHGERDAEKDAAGLICGGKRKKDRRGQHITELSSLPV